MEKLTVIGIGLWRKKLIYEFSKLDDAEHLESSFCIKTVLPNMDKTDDKPTIIEKINNKFTTMFSDKIPTCVDTVYYLKKLLKIYDVKFIHMANF